MQKGHKAWYSANIQTYVGQELHQQYPITVVKLLKIITDLAKLEIILKDQALKIRDIALKRGS